MPQFPHLQMGTRVAASQGDHEKQEAACAARMHPAPGNAAEQGTHSQQLPFIQGSTGLTGILGVTSSRFAKGDTVLALWPH